MNPGSRSQMAAQPALLASAKVNPSVLQMASSTVFAVMSKQSTFFKFLKSGFYFLLLFQFSSPPPGGVPVCAGTAAMQLLAAHNDSSRV